MAVVPRSASRIGRDAYDQPTTASRLLPNRSYPGGPPTDPNAPGGLGGTPPPPPPPPEPEPTPAPPPTPAPTPDYITDGYGVPKYMAQNFGAALPGYDAEKWGNPLHQTPKYVWGRIYQSHPNTPEGR